ncbi:hypothetical protein PIB30_059262 [Stylosanthes scabra]|uniref:Uncharacterized protein n=1 Tax=Stylosanthes scabra TaxID=79078 RepID=A0ABU6YM31_9FABA|nr:hypothetical protein [Stylosanthes scabra]
MPKVPSAGRELMRRLSSGTQRLLGINPNNGSLRANVTTTPKQPVPPFWVLSALPLRILRVGEDPVTIVLVFGAIVEEHPVQITVLARKRNLIEGQRTSTPLSHIQPTDLIRADTSDL